MVKLLKAGGPMLNASGTRIKREQIMSINGEYYRNIYCISIYVQHFPYVSNRAQNLWLQP